MNIPKPSDSKQSEYFRRIKLALEFIHDNLDQSIRLDDVAGASYFSAYHFHRIFHALVGETVNDYISRKRMEKAAYRLIGNPELSITEVSGLGGFSSSANFSKAFKLYFGVSPSELRKPGSIKNSKIGKIYRKYGKAFNPSDLYSQFYTSITVFESEKLKEMLMQVKVKEIKEKPIAYLTTPKGYELESIYETWDKIISWAKLNQINSEKEHRFAICHDNPAITPEDKCRYDASIEVSTGVHVSSPFQQTVIPGGKYAIAYYNDEGEKINNFMTELCSQWFPESGYEPDNYPPIFNYLNDDREDDIVEMDVYIKLKELNST